ASGRDDDILTDTAGGLDDVVQRSDGLVVAARLQTAVRVDPQLAQRQLVDGAAQQRLDLSDARHPGRVDVVHAGADAVVEAGARDVGDDLHAAAGGFDRGDIGVERADRVDHDAELR